VLPDTADAPLSPRTTWLLLAFITLVAAGLRLPFLDHQSLWLDEIYTRDVLGASSISGLWHQLEATESTPPLYYLLGWALGARSAPAMRVLPALALTAAAPLAYPATRRLIGQRPALAAAALLAVAPMLVAYATDARSYGLFVLAALLSLWGLSAVLEHATSGRCALWALASIACVWTHYFGVFLIAGELLVLLLMRPEARSRTLALALLIAAGSAPLLPVIAQQSGDERAGFIAAIPLGSRLTHGAREFAMGANVPRSSLEAAGLALFGLGALAGVFLAARAPRAGARIPLLLAAFSIGVPLLLAVTRIDDRFYARNLIAALPLVIAIAAPALLRLRALPLATYLTLAAITSVWVATDWRYEQLDWRDALARVERVDPRAPILALTRASGPVIRTYLGRGPESSGPAPQSTAWLIVEPTRPSGARALAPAPAPGLPGFTPSLELQTHGFRAIEERATVAQPLPARALPGAVLFSGR
jgi:4-amino-4-deoxy-L-arabinose transferase-like glycosyltransferase